MHDERVDARGKGWGVRGMGICMFWKENAPYPPTKLLHFKNKSVNYEKNNFFIDFFRKHKEFDWNALNSWTSKIPMSANDCLFTGSLKLVDIDDVGGLGG